MSAHGHLPSVVSGRISWIKQTLLRLAKSRSSSGCSHVWRLRALKPSFGCQLPLPRGAKSPPLVRQDKHRATQSPCPLVPSESRRGPTGETGVSTRKIAWAEPLSFRRTICDLVGGPHRGGRVCLNGFHSINKPHRLCLRQIHLPLPRGGFRSRG